ncbi:hypothetical protein ACOMHN_044887 [Nucella lapillus]
MGRQRIDGVAASSVCCFDRPMKSCLNSLRPYLVNNLEVNDLMDYLEGSVFSTVSYIKAKKTREDKVRKLLDDLIKCPASAFWKFITALFQPHVDQGHIAMKILKKYRKMDGHVTESVAKLQREYREKTHVRPDEVVRNAQELISLPQHQSHQAPAPGHSRPEPNPQQGHGGGTHAGFSLMDLEVVNNGGHRVVSISARGKPVTTIHEEAAARDAGIERDADVPDSSGASGTLLGDDAGSRVRSPPQGANVYREKRNADPDGVYKMESNPRGMALIINIKTFHHLTNRGGTDEDCERLRRCFQDLHFDVQVRHDLTSQGIITETTAFAKRLNQQSPPVDSVMVAILTHGYQRDVLFGADGRVAGNGVPICGTFITTDYLQDLFGSTQCLAMAGKPKMFILQACRGNQVDRCLGQRPAPTDVVPVLPPPSYQTQPDKADVIFLHATISRYVAYRNYFIPKLVEVFQRHSRTKHVQELQPIVRREMAQYDHITFTIPEDKSTLMKDWYLNPPPTAFR